MLAVLAALALLLGLVTGYARLALFESDGFSDRATAALDDDAVKAEIARRVTDDLVLNANADLVAFRPVIESVVEGIVSAGIFQNLFRTAARDVHSAFFAGNQDTATFTLADVGVVLRGALQALAPKISKEIGGGADVDVTPIDPPGWLTEMAQAGRDLGPLSVVLLVLGLVLVAIALWRSRDRRHTLLTFGIAVVACGVIAAVALGVVRTIVLARIDDTGIRDAARGIWDAYLGDLRNGLYVFAACGAVVAAAASSLLRPVDVADPLRRGWAAVTTVPERRWVRVVRALALIAVGALIVIEPDAFLHLLALAVGLYVAYAGVSELLRITIAPATEEQREAERTRGRRVLVASGIATAVIVIGGAIFIASGGTVSERAHAVETEGCNGADGALRSPAQRGGVSLGAQRDVGGDQPGLAAGPAGRGLHRSARGRDSRAADRRALRPAHRERQGEDRSLGSQPARAQDVREGARPRGAGRGASHSRPDRQLEADGPAPGLPLSPVLRARRDPDRRRLPRVPRLPRGRTRTRC